MAEAILERILAAKRERLEAARAARPLAEVRAAAADAAPARDFAAALRRPGVRVIAEIKRRSPSRGLIRRGFDPGAVARAFAAGGADCCSVLTEEDFFDGRLADLEQVRGEVGLPLLRKDFLFDSYQVHESRASGADAVLLIAAVLAPGALADLAGLAASLGLAALVEVHEEAELEAALRCPQALIGINNRDLRTFAVDLAASERLAALLPPHRLVVAESGIRGPADVARLEAAGIHAFLVGEHLMRASDPAAALAALKASGDPTGAARALKGGAA